MMLISPEKKRFELLEGIKAQMPIEIVKFNLPKKFGFMIVDAINGFCTVGCGPLAPPAPDEVIEGMVREIKWFARICVENEKPIIFFMDAHEPGVPEPPYPPHCEKGSGQELIVPELLWLEQRTDLVTFVPKDSINGFVGSFTKSDTGLDGWFNTALEWINDNEIECIVAGGICTDICDMEIANTFLSARNHGMTPTVKEIVAYTPACATYDLPIEVAVSLGLPKTAAHPRDITDYIGLYFMASRGAILANELILPN